MIPSYDFDTRPFFDTAARDLLRLFGGQAFAHAERAIEKMIHLDHEEGLYMWREIRTAMWANQGSVERMPSSAIH